VLRSHKQASRDVRLMIIAWPEKCVRPDLLFDREGKVNLDAVLWDEIAKSLAKFGVIYWQVPMVSI